MKWLALQVSELFDMFDIDNDGTVSFDDFNTCLRSNPLLIALFASYWTHNGSLVDGMLEVV